MNIRILLLIGWLMAPMWVAAQLDSIPWTLTVWGQQRSNSLDRDMGQKLFRGGHITPEMVASSSAAQGQDMGALGFTTGVDWRWTSLKAWKNSNARICGSIQGKWVGDSRWTPELLDLVFSGNAGHLGRWDVLDGSRARTAAWMNAAIGLEGQNQNRIEIGLVYLPAYTGVHIRNGYFHVDEDIDSLQAYMRADAEVSQRAAWGSAINAEWHFLREEAPFAFHLRIQNFGWAVVPKMTQWKVDTLIETTGLTFQGPEWSLEAAQQEGWGADFASVDSNKTAVRMLPARLDASFEYPLGPRSGWDVQVQLGEWMPLPRAITGYRRAIGKQWQAGIQMIAGGWGRLRPAAWARWRVPGEHAIVIYLEDPFGWGTHSAFGRGITLQFQNM